MSVAPRIFCGSRPRANPFSFSDFPPDSEPSSDSSSEPLFDPRLFRFPEISVLSASSFLRFAADLSFSSVFFLFVLDESGLDFSAFVLDLDF